jgi:hypothetical protein
MALVERGEVAAVLLLVAPAVAFFRRFFGCRTSATPAGFNKPAAQNDRRRY